MQTFKTAQPNSQLYCHQSFLLRGDDINRNQMRFSDLGDFHHSSPVFQQQDALDLTSTCMFNSVKSNNLVIGASDMHYGTTINTNVGSAEIASNGAGCSDAGQQQQQLMYNKGIASLPLGNSHVENWADSGMADNSQQTDDNSTDIDIDTDDKDLSNRGKAHSKDQTKFRAEDHKTLRRLAQNREAARKSRLRKKAYVQQLESSRVKLVQLEQELQRARQQGIFIANSGDQGHSTVGNGALAFDLEYGHWVDEHQRLLNDLRSALNSQMGDNELHLLVDGVMAHYNELFRLKKIGAKADIFHMLYGLWKTPVERFFIWHGAFRSSELLKIVKSHLEPLTENQMVGICNLQQSTQQAEDALSQGMEVLKQSLLEILSSTSSVASTGSGNVADYMGQMAFAMNKLASLEEFLHQADLLKQETLQQLQRILTTRQTARALLVRNDYISRLRALSSLWLARPRE
ncbi:unnamed protein product [Lathyrus sativus]|nr:unnamed protein product [Lathyrus sativus]